MSYEGLWFLGGKATLRPIASVQERGSELPGPCSFLLWRLDLNRNPRLKPEGRLDIGISGSCRFGRIWHIIMVRSFYPIFSEIGMSAFLVSDGRE